WRVEHGDGGAIEVDSTDVAPRQRCEIDATIRRGSYAVGAEAARRAPGLDLAGGWVKPSVEAVLPGEPEHALVIERRGVQIRVAAREPEDVHRLGGGVNADDRILPTVGHPGRVVRADDHTVR